MRAGAVLVALGLALIAVGARRDRLRSVRTAVGLFVYGVGIGVWDVAMNVEGAAVERRLGRAIMPRFHAGWSLGSVRGRRASACWSRPLDVPWSAHLALAAVARAGRGCRRPGRSCPSSRSRSTARRPGRRGVSRAPWRIGLMVLAFALTEGAANDWLALALIDGYDVDALGRRRRLRGCSWSR